MNATSEDVLACSFCARPHTDVDKLIAGPGVFICGDCVRRCNKVLADTPTTQGPLPRLPEWGSMTDVQMLEQLPRIAATSHQVERSLKSWIDELRRRSVTWTRIGEALSMTRQSAWERFSGEE